MLKSLVVLAIAGTMSVPAAAQTQNPPAANQPQTKPQMVKKRVCEDVENAFSRVKSRSCKTVMVPAEGSEASSEKAPAQQPGNAR